MKRDLHESWARFKRLITSRIVAGPLIAAVFMFTAINFLSMRNHYIIIDGGNVIIHTTYENNVFTALVQAGVNINNTDLVSVPEVNAGGGFAEIVIERMSYATVYADGKTIRLMTRGESVSYMLERAGVKMRPSDIVEPAASTPSYDGMEITVTRYDTTLRHENSAIPFEELRHENRRIPKDTENVIQEGVEGVTESVYQLNYVNGQLVGEEYIGSRVLREPTARIVEYGSAGTVVVDGVMYTYTQILDVTATAYSAEGRPAARTATGTIPRVGAIAVDPKVIPLGSRVYVEGANGRWVYGIATCEDTGGVIKGNIIDLYFNTVAECWAFGRRRATVYILE
ncbi:MAG: 3D domain-containing protein [Oscillospiraceae bacterium]|nr:3D domain-containing protein [Oscillospiraceae bacterium]